jgi:hypothetical protein
MSTTCGDKPFKITIKWGAYTLDEDRPVETYDFETQAELDAFKLGLTEIESWDGLGEEGYDVIEDLADEDLFECTACHKILDIEESVKVGVELVCSNCYADRIDRSMVRLLGSVRT